MYQQPIPEQFFNSITEAPFDACADCGTSLLEEDCHYVIEKVFKNNPEYGTKEVLFEVAICDGCMHSAMDIFSEESKQSLMQFFEGQNIAPRVIDPEEEDPSYLIENCMINGTPVNQDIEYQLQGEFIGNEMVLGKMPLAIGFEAINSLVEVLSESTKDGFEDYMNRIKPVDPEIEDLLPTRTPVLI